MKRAIAPLRDEDFPEWYQQVVKAADLAENSPVRGCMVIKPWGYGIWETLKGKLDKRFKETGHENAYFPLFIPLSHLQKEADHVEGFAKECAVVTHHRLEQGPDGKLIPGGELDEPLIVRPTSETIIGATFAKWVESHRDLPILINQWANVVRWEMRPRIFLRTAEFLWQEGHTVHATKEEAVEESLLMHDLYATFAKEVLALPVIKGEKSEAERFPGAVNTYTIEAMMQDRKALQCGTSHFFGQNFAKASEIKFTSKEGTEEYGWTTSWGTTTRFIGALVMTHGDDDGMILPPRVAAHQIVILPVMHKEETKEQVLSYCKELKSRLEATIYCGQNISVVLDTRDLRGGEKTWSWIKRGIPVRIEVGPRDIEQGHLCITQRNKGPKEREMITPDAFIASLTERLDGIQNALYERALAEREAHTHTIDTLEEFEAFFTPKNKKKPEIHGGFALTHFAGDVSTEKDIQKKYGVTIRCIPFDLGKEKGTCPFTGKPSAQRVIFAKSY